MFISTLIEKVKTALQSPVCLQCEQKLDARSQFCRHCHEKLALREPNPVADTPLAILHAATTFNPAVKRMLYAHKFHNRLEHIPQLAGMLIQYWESLPMNMGFAVTHPENVLVIPIPPHDGSLSLIDGFASRFARHFGYDYQYDVLQWRRDVKPQHRIHDKRQRFSNIAQGMTLKTGIVSGYERVLVMDDLTTTGATFMEASRAFQDEAGSAAINRHGNVICLAVTKVPLGSQMRHVAEQEPA